MNRDEMLQIITPYCENMGKKLNETVDKVVNQKLGGTSGKDMDSFYSIANEVIFDIWREERYDQSKGDFDGFLYNVLLYSFIDAAKRANRSKRCNKRYILDKNGNKVLDENGAPKTYVLPDISFDSPIDDTDGLTYGDTIRSNFDLEKYVEETHNEFADARITEYLNTLNSVQREILRMKMSGVPIQDIKAKLKLNNKEYDHHCATIKSFERVSILGIRDSSKREDKREEPNMNSQTLEKSKKDRIQISSIIKKMDKYVIRFDHPLQRASDRWPSEMKGNLISDILQDNPIPELVFAEQVVDGVATIWDLDGKQRCTNVHSFYNNEYKITKNVRRWNIEYQAMCMDAGGNPVFDESGSPKYEKRTFDIRGKKFSDLPEELQDRFKDYNFDYIQYINCSPSDIAYHVVRYNEGRKMTESEKGVTRLGEGYAALVKSISNMPFFKDGKGYKTSEFKNGTIHRVVVESVMASNFLDEWKKKQEDMCDYLQCNAEVTDFENFEDMVERLEKVVTDDTAIMFNARDSFLWFGLFARFVKSETDDKKFVEFMTEFAQSLHSKEIDGVTFDDLNGKSTKDKGIVIQKIDHLEKLMLEFLNINKEDVEISDVFGFVRENVSEDATDDDIEFYEECLHDFTVNVDNSSKLLDRQNFPSLLALAAYAITNDLDTYIEEWLVYYFRRNKDYIRNQKQNFEVMKQDFDLFVTRAQKKTA